MSDLVFLGACDTAVGPVRFAEGMSGMQGAFLRAGARGVIATLWPVEDVYASQFAADFYRRYTDGSPAAQALSETQRAWLAAAPGVRENEQAYRRMTAWAHVFYAPLKRARGPPGARLGGIGQPRGLASNSGPQETL